MNAIEVDVFGERLSLRGNADENYVQELVQYVEGQMNTIAGNLTTSTPTKVAILAAINIADQLFTQESRRQAGEAEVERRATELLECIDKQIGRDSTL
jgi:cell division protein ZapA